MRDRNRDTYTTTVDGAAAHAAGCDRDENGLYYVDDRGPTWADVDGCDFDDDDGEGEGDD